MAAEFSEPGYQSLGQLNETEIGRINAQLLIAGKQLGDYVLSQGFQQVYTQTTDRFPSYLNDVINEVAAAESPRVANEGEHEFAGIIRKGVVVGMKFGDYLRMDSTDHYTIQYQALEQIRQGQIDGTVFSIEELVRDRQRGEVSEATSKALPVSATVLNPNDTYERRKELFSNTVLYFASNATMAFIARRGKRSNVWSRFRMAQNARKFERSSALKKNDPKFDNEYIHLTEETTIE